MRPTLPIRDAVRSWLASDRELTVAWVAWPGSDASPGASDVSAATVDELSGTRFDVVVVGPGIPEQQWATASASVGSDGLFAVLALGDRTGMGRIVQRAVTLIGRAGAPAPLAHTCQAVLSLGCDFVSVLPLGGMRGEALVLGRIWRPRDMSG